MPRRQRRSKRRQPASDGWIIWACDGDHPPDTPETQTEFQEWLTLEYFETPEEKSARWRDHGDRALAVWVASNPGTRPDNWWRYASPEPRRQLSGSGTARGSHQRFPAMQGVPGVLGAVEGDEPVFETEREYLERLGLLMEGE